MLPRVLPMAGVASLIACGGGRQSPAPMPRVGSYDFVINTAMGLVAGVLHVLPDTVLVEAGVGEGDHPRNEGACYRDLVQENARYIRYQCDSMTGYDGFAIIVDRRNPSGGSTWRASFAVRKERVDCVQFDKHGKCVAVTTVMYTETQNQNGELRLHFRSSTPRP